MKLTKYRLFRDLFDSPTDFRHFNQHNQYKHYKHYQHGSKREIFDGYFYADTSGDEIVIRAKRNINESDIIVRFVKPFILPDLNQCHRFDIYEKYTNYSKNNRNEDKNILIDDSDYECYDLVSKLFEYYDGDGVNLNSHFIKKRTLPELQMESQLLSKFRKYGLFFHPLLLDTVGRMTPWYNESFQWNQIVVCKKKRNKKKKIA